MTTPDLDAALEWADMAAKKPELYDDCLGRALVSLAAEVRRLTVALNHSAYCEDKAKSERDKAEARVEKTREAWADFKFRLVNTYGGPSPYLKTEELEAVISEPEV